MSTAIWEASLEAAARSFEPATHTGPVTPGDLARIIDPRTVQTPALDLIDAALEQLLDEPDGRLIITMPPQEGKSTRVARDFPAWALVRNPDLRIISGSYAQGLANRNGRAVRNAIAAHPDLGITIADDHGAASEWSLAGHHGGLVSVGRGAGVSGRPADLLIIDDPLKDRAEADSPTIRDTCWDWWTDALSARLAPGAPVVLITTRWHEDDMVGRLTALDVDAGWQVLNIPAQCEDPDTDPLGRDLDEYMDSARRRTPEQWEARKRTAGSRTWAALYQGHPSPQVGNVFHREWWRHWHHPPTRLDHVIQSWDMAFKGTAHSDFVVGQVWARIGADFYLLDQVRGRWNAPETIAQVRLLSQRWPMAIAKLVEDKANGPAVIDMLRAEIPGLIPVEPRGGKVVRAEAVSPLPEAGNVYLPPLTVPWVTDLITEAASFPNATHDDQVDALTQALAHLAISPDKPATYGTGFFDIG